MRGCHGRCSGCRAEVGFARTSVPSVRCAPARALGSMWASVGWLQSCCRGCDSNENSFQQPGPLYCSTSTISDCPRTLTPRYLFGLSCVLCLTFRVDELWCRFRQSFSSGLRVLSRSCCASSVLLIPDMLLSWSSGALSPCWALPCVHQRIRKLHLHGVH